MPQKKIPTPPIAGFPLYKVILLGLFGSLGISLMSVAVGIPARGDVMLTAGDVIIGIITFALSMFNWLSWRPRRSYKLRWIAVLVGNVYISSLLLLAGLSCWNALLNGGWRHFLNVILVGLFVIAWFLPMISSHASKRLSFMQDKLSFTLLKFGGPATLITTAGILGARFGLNGSTGSTDSRIMAMAFLFPLASLSLAQYASDYLWPYRPWAKEDE
jgi:hypothetical protein